jgi:hypothetical protein
VLPVAAVVELSAVTLFALNIAVTAYLPPPRPVWDGQSFATGAEHARQPSGATR